MSTIARASMSVGQISFSDEHVGEVWECFQGVGLSGEKP